ncbi:MAG: transglycosylase SLT domain-containing protein [Candidatus Cloacimonadia bacterium]
MRLQFLRSNSFGNDLVKMIIVISTIVIAAILGYRIGDQDKFEGEPLEFNVEHFCPGGSKCGKNPVIDSHSISEAYLWNRIQPKTLRDTVILTVVLNSDSIWTPDWLLAQAWTESRWIDTVWSLDTLGNKLCCGIMQIYPGTAVMVGRNPERLEDAKYNIETAYIYYRYLTEYHNSYIQALNGYTGGSISFSWFYRWYVTNQAERLEWLR